MTRTLEPPAADNEAQLGTLTPADLGVGARVTLAVMADDYVRTILDAVAAADAAVPGIVRETDAVSSFLRGPEQDLADYLRALLVAAARSGAHVTAALLLSRGCPGEVTCELPPGFGAPVAPVTLPPTGVTARAQWSLYPLADEASVPGAPAPDHMRDITAAIDLAKDRGIYAGTAHFVTELSGDVADILEVVCAAWLLVGRTVQHTVCHLTFSLNSPTASAGVSE
jgi:hypothetical protein